MDNVSLEGVLRHVHEFTGSNAARASITRAYEMYSALKEAGENDFVKELADSIKFLAEDKKSAAAVKKGTELLMSDPVVDMCTKYSGDAASELFEVLSYCVHESLDAAIVGKYISWLEDGQMGKLLKYTREMNGYQNLKVKNNIYSILYVGWRKTDEFDKYAAKIQRKKIPLEKKIEQMAILRDLVNANMSDYIDALSTRGAARVGQLLHSDLDGLRPYKDLASIKTGVRFITDRKRMPNAPFLTGVCKQYGSVKKWMCADETTRKVIASMKNAGFDTDFYVASGKVVSHRKDDPHYSNDWTGALKSIMLDLLGSKNEKTLPRISIPGVSAGRIYKELAPEYKKALDKNKRSAKEVTRQVTALIHKGFRGKKVPRAVHDTLDKITALEHVLNRGGSVVSFRGASVTARVWKRIMPDDLYDSEILRCCMFFPAGEETEAIPIFLMDPKTTMVQFYVDGIKEPVAVATFYAGTHKGRPALLMDTWEAGSLAYSALSYAKMHSFALDTMIKFAKRVGAEKLFIFSESPYGRPREFCDYMKRQQYKSQKVEFEAIDSEDSVLAKYSKAWTHHYTDAFDKGNRLKGITDAFAFDCRDPDLARIRANSKKGTPASK